MGGLRNEDGFAEGGLELLEVLLVTLGLKLAMKGKIAFLSLKIPLFAAALQAASYVSILRQNQRSEPTRG